MNKLLPSLSEAIPAQALDRNIRTLLEIQKQLMLDRNVQDRVADSIANFAGSTTFFLLHVVWFVVWIVVNLHWTPMPAFDPFPFGLLTMIVSLEAIFLSTFILISQNRQAIVSDQRSDLDLHVSLLAEYEITRVLILVDAIADSMKLKASKDPELEELKQDIKPELLLKEIERLKNGYKTTLPGVLK